MLAEILRLGFALLVSRCGEAWAGRFFLFLSFLYPSFSLRESRATGIPGGSAGARAARVLAALPGGVPAAVPAWAAMGLGRLLRSRVIDKCHGNKI